MAEYQILANGKDDDLGHSFLPEFKRFERFGLTLPYDITPQGDIINEGWTTFGVPSIYDRTLSINIRSSKPYDRSVDCRKTYRRTGNFVGGEHPSTYFEQLYSFLVPMSLSR